MAGSFTPHGLVVVGKTNPHQITSMFLWWGKRITGTVIPVIHAEEMNCRLQPMRPLWLVRDPVISSLLMSLGALIQEFFMISLIESLFVPELPFLACKAVLEEHGITYGIGYGLHEEKLISLDIFLF
jgi:hypothetical protein